MKNISAIILMVTAFLGSAAEWISNSDFENETIPWNPNSKKVKLSISKDGLPPDGGCGALVISNTGNEKKLTLVHGLKKKPGPGTYKFQACVDTTRCTKAVGFVAVRLNGSVRGKWTEFCSFYTRGTPKGGWKKDEWTKFEKIFSVPEGGVIKNAIIYLSNIHGMVMVDNISLKDYGNEELHKEQMQKKQAAAMQKEQENAQKNFPVGIMESRKYRSLYPINEIPELNFRLKNPSDKQTSVSVQFQTRDYFGSLVKEQKKDFSLPPKGEICEILRYPEFTNPGFYAVTAKWQSGKISGSAQSSFVKVGPVPEKKDPLFGINWDSGNDIPTWNLLGVGSKGVLFRWQLRMPREKKALEARLKEVEDLHRNGITVIGGLRMHDGTGWSKKNFWKSFMPEKAKSGKVLPSLEDCEEIMVPFIEELVSKTKPYIRHWSCSGEIDGYYMRRTDGLEHFIGMVKFSSRTIHKTYPDAIVASLGVAGSDGRMSPRFPWVKRLLPQLKDDLDALAPDAYTGGQRYGKGYISADSEESQNVQMMKDLLKIAEVTKKKVAWIGERGPSIVNNTPLDSAYGTRMGNIVAREFIQLKSLPKILFWLYYRPDNLYKNKVFDWAMWKEYPGKMLFPRQVVSAYAATARIMAFAEFIQKLPLHQDLPCWVFRKDGKYFAAVWYNGKEKLKAILPADVPVEAKDVQGNPVPVKDRFIYFGEAPVYLYAKDLASLKKLLKNAPDNIAELKFDIDAGNYGKTMLTVRNMTGSPITLKLKKAEVSGAAGTQVIPYQDSFTLAAGEVRSIEKALPGDSAVFHLETGKGRKYTASGKVKPVPVPLVNSFDELKKKAVTLHLNNPASQIPGYDDWLAHGNYKGLNDLSAVFRLGYDQQHLYLEVQVKDDIHSNNVISSAMLYEGDSIQFALDTRRDARTNLMRGIRGYTNDDFNFVSALASGKPITYCHVSSEATKGEIRDKTYKLIPEIIRDETTKTTLYRIKLAFADLVPLKPEKGRVFGFSMLVFDRDPHETKYHMDYTDGVGMPFDPSKYPAFRFE